MQDKNKTKITTIIYQEPKLRALPGVPEGLPLDYQGKSEVTGARALLGELPLDHQGKGQAPGGVSGSLSRRASRAGA